LLLDLKLRLQEGLLKIVLQIGFFLEEGLVAFLV
jgi:hypothetical protein